MTKPIPIHPELPPVKERGVFYNHIGCYPFISGAGRFYANYDVLAEREKLHASIEIVIGRKSDIRQHIMYLPNRRLKELYDMLTSGQWTYRDNGEFVYTPHDPITFEALNQFVAEVNRAAERTPTTELPVPLWNWFVLVVGLCLLLLLLDSVI